MQILHFTQFSFIGIEAVPPPFCCLVSWIAIFAFLPSLLVGGLHADYNPGVFFGKYFHIHLLAGFICSNTYNLLQVCKILQQSVLLASSVCLDFMPEQIIYLTVP